MSRFLIPLIVALLQTQPAPLARPVEGDYVIRNFRFTSGETLPELRMHYRTYGTPARNAQGVVTNAVLIMHGTGGTGAQFVGRGFAGELFGQGQPLDASRYYIILPDDIGHGQSSKPSDGLRARFPRYGYIDMVEAEYRLVTEGLGVNHLRLVMGTSMGGMHTWLWGERYPDVMDALMPLASLPTQIAGRNRVWRRTVIDAIRQDPEWKDGEYTTQPRSLRTAAQLLWLVGSNPILRQTSAPDARRRRSRHRSVRGELPQDRRRQRHPLRARGVARLRSRPGPREDQGAARRHQLGGRLDQPAGAADPGARNQARAERHGPSCCRSATGPPATGRTRWRRCGRRTCLRCCATPSGDDAGRIYQSMSGVCRPFVRNSIAMRHSPSTCRL